LSNLDVKQHLHTFPTRGSSDLLQEYFIRKRSLPKRKKPQLSKKKKFLEVYKVCLIGCWLLIFDIAIAIYIEYLCTLKIQKKKTIDRKSTRLNSSHVKISYAVFC